MRPMAAGRRIGFVLWAITALGTSLPCVARAADNTATGDIAGDDSDLADSNTFTINTTTLVITKTAFLTDGTQLSSGASLPRGTWVQFLVYVDNPTGVPAVDVNVQDVLDPAFAYQAASLHVVNTVPTGAAAAAIYAAAVAAPVLTDAVDAADVAGISGTTISVGAGAGNAQLDVPAGSVWALLFAVEMQ